MDLYNIGLDALAAWETATYHWLLCTDGTFNADLNTVADLLGGATPMIAEATVSGYARVAASTKVRVVDDTNNRISYTAADPDFGTLAAGEDITGVVLYRLVTNDADSIPIGYATLTPTPSDALDPFTVVIVGGVVAYIDQAA